MRYKVGDKVVIRDDLVEGEWYGEFAFDNECGSNMTESIGEILKIRKVYRSDYEMTNDTEFWTDAMINHEATKKLKEERSMDNLKVGDILIDNDGDEKEVIEIVGCIVFLMTKYGSSTFSSIEELKEYDYKIKGEQEEVEMTMEQINKALGKTVKVVE